MDDEKLIELVRQYEFLYNLKHPKYMDAVKKELAWKNISEQLKQPAAACKQRWQALRDAYRRALNKRKEKTGQSAHRIKKWKYEEEMMFVTPFFMPRKTQESDEVTSYADDDDELDNRYPQYHANISKTLYTDSVTDTTRVDETITADVVECHKKTFDVEILQNVKMEVVEEDIQNDNAEENQNKEPLREEKDGNIDPLQSPSTVMIAKLLDDQSKTDVQRGHDEIDRFFLSISDTVKKFPPYLQALVKNKIFTLVSEVELQQLAPPNFK